MAEQQLVECRRELDDQNKSCVQELWRREQLALTLWQLEQELRKLHQVRDDLRRKLEKRQKQFRTLLSSAQQLQALLRREELSITHSMKSIAAAKRVSIASYQKSTSSSPYTVAAGAGVNNVAGQSGPIRHMAHVQLVKQPFVSVLRQRPTVSTRIALFRPHSGYMVLS